MDKRQILLNRRCSVLRIQTVNLVQLVGPVVTRFAECPTPHMSEALSFTEIELVLLQGFFGTLALRDVLGRTKHFIRLARRVPLYGAHTMDNPNFTVRTNDTMFNVGANVADKGFFSCAEDELSIFGVDSFADHRDINGTLLRTHPKDA